MYIAYVNVIWSITGLLIKNEIITRINSIKEPEIALKQ